MTIAVEQLFKQAMSLPSESRAKLADLLVESLNSDDLSRVDRLWMPEAKRRRHDVINGRVRAVPGEVALLKVRNAIRQ